MSLQRPPLWQIIKPHLTVFDGALSLIVFLILSVGIVTLYSAGMNFPGRVEDQLRNILVAFIVMWVAANVSPQLLLRLAVPVYTVGVTLLIAVALFGIIKKGSRRWLNIGMVVQPSEIMKIAMPLMLAWYFQKREGMLRWDAFLVAAILLLIPGFLIIRQPDLGTGLLVLAAGFYVIFFAGLPWKILLGLFVAGAASLPVVWSFMHDYQRQRVMMLIDPTSDPLGKGFHIIQSTIAIGSGGVTGKGWLMGTQTHLEFIPERTTDFIFSVYSEEFGLIGNCVLLVLYLLLIGRGLMITANAPTLFTRLLGGAITMIFFTYAFVNMGMVSGILPVVGVPLPFMSYGGTALVTLGLGAGILMSIQRHRKLVQS
ncbi:rod shape-determining protein RodA [Herbaspirillum huttiense]|jgi:rod shape determining protein RodA|uniref:Peptidoglycan glycosyltransferase MrdB n=5 Tax=Pseudomonadota TaxID=1224 RepID=A0AAJ2LR37_9BURK|nr:MULTISPECIES: rod shape-determining protein RodA [Herbaspirillum]MBW9334647.1 rod shape-determining protein RodA [Herbaspirillum sp. RU 5E]MBN9356472.1 rod shape-determining protein RodA [Herbaspirillum huttiense]MBO14290.1 rod shape-determining protein RodA [Herbaspirillum sp.]MBP1317157.1 rod shape determining protein RodA [Herbaspirillum sp. 1130]MCP3658697.1 rod shape-determining protein RodA [Herbaspirillum sp.]|tara:strand:+ start:6196 stop:7305 length:1110 start_codon:yes stop_codon:yes gene_type:complete